ncbi:hypothetical protein UFOVP591_46 [uncultured Caudovirales phage]|jgi:hypothetical protein|uniref:DUF3987 domain-containing protein n=1 Tax=uncultured Caudovirales phage TaxID=2100421 RepID=A0A6J5N1L8_9CAUD|nr:hypothetical protein UFOVP591_46 [uncultured Caudovirales phage]
MLTKSDIYSCPGLLGDVATYIHDSIETSQPGTALAAAISLMGALLSKRVESTTGLQPHVYTGIIAGTGTGKTTAQNLIKNVVSKSGIPNLLMGNPASASGLTNSLGRSSRQLFIWDEMGHAISAYSKSANSSESLILSKVLKLFSADGSSIIGDEYANKGRVDIEGGAYLSIFGASTPVRFYESLNQNFIHDGYLPRFLLFFENPEMEYQITRNEQKELSETTKAQCDDEENYILERMRYIEKWWPKSEEGDLASVAIDSMEKKKLQIKIDLEKVVGPKNGVVRTYNYKEEIRELKKRATTQIEKDFLNRRIEYVIKLCLCTISEDGLFDPKNISWAISLVTRIQDEMIRNCRDYIYPNERVREHNRILDKFLNLMGPGQSLTKAQVTNKTQRWCSNKERYEIVSILVESGDWEETKSDYDPISGQKKSTTYKRL